MNEQALLEILQTHYGMKNISLRFLREGGGHTYMVEGERKYFLKVIGTALQKPPGNPSPLCDIWRRKIFLYPGQF